MTVICTLGVIYNGLILLLTLIGLARVEQLVVALARVDIPLHAYLFSNFVLPALSLAAMVGLWRMRKWGWRLGASIAVLNLSSTALVLVTRATVDLDGSATTPYSAITVPLVIVVYLMRAKIIERFGWLDDEVRTLRLGVLATGFLLGLVFVLSLPRAWQGT